MQLPLGKTSLTRRERKSAGKRGCGPRSPARSLARASPSAADADAGAIVAVNAIGRPRHDGSAAVVAICRARRGNGTVRAGAAAVTTNPRGGEGVNDPANRKSGLALSAASSGLGRECIRSARHHINSAVISISYNLTSTFLIRVKATEQRPGCDPEPRVSIKLGFYRERRKHLGEVFRKLAEHRETRKTQVRMCVQRRLACSAGERPAGARVRSPVVWIAGWRETKTLKPIDNVSLGKTTSHRAVTTVNVKVASKVRSPEGRVLIRRAKAAWGAEI